MHLDVARLGPGPHYRAAQQRLKQTMKALEQTNKLLVEVKEGHAVEKEERKPREPALPAARHKVPPNVRAKALPF